MHQQLPMKRLRTQEAANYLLLSRSTLEKYRLTGKGPRFSKMGRIVTYSVSDLDAWADSLARFPTGGVA